MQKNGLHDEWAEGWENDSQSIQSDKEFAVDDGWVDGWTDEFATSDPAEESPGVIETVGKGLMHGTYGLGESVGTGVEYLGNRIENDTVVEAGQTAKKYWKNKAEQYTPSDEINGKNVWDNPEILKNAEWWFYNVSDMVPALAASIAPGAGAVKGIQAVTAIPKLAKLGGAIVGGLTGGAIEGTQTYNAVLEKGGTEEEAARSAELMTAGAGVLNAFGVGKVLAKAGTGFKGKVIKHLGAGAWEGISEGLEEPTEVFAKYFGAYLAGEELPDNLKEDLIQSAKEALTVAPIATLTGVGGSVVAGGKEGVDIENEPSELEVSSPKAGKDPEGVVGDPQPEGSNPAKTDMAQALANDDDQAIDDAFEAILNDQASLPETDTRGLARYADVNPFDYGEEQGPVPYQAPKEPAPYNHGEAEQQAGIDEFRREKAAQALQRHQDSRRGTDQSIPFQDGLNTRPDETQMPLPGDMPEFQRDVEGRPDEQKYMPFADLADRMNAEPDVKPMDQGEVAPDNYDDGIDVSSDAEFVPRSVHNQAAFQKGIEGGFGRQDVGGEDLLSLRPTFQQDNNDNGEGGGSPAQAPGPAGGHQKIQSRLETKYQDLINIPAAENDSLDIETSLQKRELTPKALKRKLNENPGAVGEVKGILADQLGELIETHKYEGHKEGAALERYLDSLLKIVDGLDDTPKRLTAGSRTDYGGQVEKRIQEKYRAITGLPSAEVDKSVYDAVEKRVITPEDLDNYLKKSDSVEDDIQNIKSIIADQIGDLVETHRYESQEEGRALEKYLDSLLEVLDRVSRDSLRNNGPKARSEAKQGRVSDNRGITSNSNSDSLSPGQSPASPGTRSSEAGQRSRHSGRTTPDSQETSEKTEISGSDGLVDISPDDINYQRAYDAHRGTSHVPDERASQEQQGYVGHMESVRDYFLKRIKPGQRAALKSELERYKQGYLKKYGAVLAAKSRTMSSMVTGPARFPTARNQKALDAEMRRHEELKAWDKKAQNAIKRELGLSGIISSDDPGAIGKLKKKLKDLESAHQIMKSVNKIARSKKKADKQKIKEMVEVGLKKEQAREILKPDYMGRTGFAPYALSNSNANIKRVKQRIIDLGKKVDDKTSSVKVGDVEIIDNVEDNRVQIFFDGKPDAEIRKKLKSNGFRWAPSVGAWQRQRSNRALSLARSVAGETLNGAKYSTNQDTAPGKGLSLEDMAARFPNQKVIITGNTVNIRFKNGKGLKITRTEKISENDHRIAVEIGRMTKAGKIIGKATAKEITLNKDLASSFTLDHELQHSLELSGILTKWDIGVLNAKAKAYHKAGKFKAKWSKDPMENRANAMAQLLEEREQGRETAVGRIVQRVADFLDGLLHVGRVSARRLAREVEGGGIYSRSLTGKKRDGKAYSVTDKKGKGDISTESHPVMPDGGVFRDPMGYLNPGANISLYGGSYGSITNNSYFSLRSLSNADQKYTKWKFDIPDGATYQEKEQILKEKAAEIKATMEKDGWSVTVRKDGYGAPVLGLIHKETEAEQKRIDEGVDSRWASGKDVFVRYGNIPESGRSYDNVSGSYEDGVSVFKGRILPNGKILIRPDNHVDTTTFHALSESGRPLFVIEGEEIGIGADGEPVLSNATQSRPKDSVKKYFYKEEIKNFPSPNPPSTPGKGVQYSTTADQIFAEDEDTFLQKASDLLSSFKHWKDKGKGYDPDVSVMAHLLKTTMYNAEKIGGAYKRLWEAIRRQDDHKFAAQRDLWYEGDLSLLEEFQAFSKQFKQEYAEIKDYLTQRDVDRKGFVVRKDKDRFQLLHWKKKNGARKVIGTYEDKEVAWKDAILIEAEESGFSEKGKEALINFRKMSHNLYHHFARNLEEAIHAYETAGKPVPQITVMGEDGNVKIDLYAAADRMGDLRGSYFPRLRNTGKWRVIGSKKGSADEMQFFDTKRGFGSADAYRAKLERKGYKTEVKKVGKLSEDLFQKLEPLMAQQQVLNTALKDMSNEDKQRVLEDANIKAHWDGDTFVLSGNGVMNAGVEGAVKHLGGEFKERFLGRTYKGEIVFEDIEGNPVDFEQAVTDAILHSGGFEVDMDLAFADAMVKQYDTVLKGRGARSRMIARSDKRGINVVKGYETDPLIAITQAMQAAAGSEAKAIVAKEGMAAIGGRDISWQDYKKDGYGAIHELEKELKELDLSSPAEAQKKEKLKKELHKIRQGLIDSYGLSPNTIIKKQRRIKNILDELKSLTRWSDIGKAQEIKAQITRAKSGLYEDYLKMVDERMLNGKTQATAHKEAVAALEDILRNQEFADRVLGTLKGLAVWQYLGFRVSSAAINMTNMVTGVPAAMNGETNNQVSLMGALGSIRRAMVDFGLHRTGNLAGEKKQIFDEIREKGWDQPVFNREAFDVLSTKWGRGWNWALENSMWIFGKTEEINRAATIAATYFAMKKSHKGKWDHSAMMEKAKDISDKAHGVYSKANKPYQMRGGNLAGLTLSAGYVFHTFEHNYLQEMYRLGFDKKQRKAALYMAFSPAIFGIGATVPVGIAKAIASALGTDDPEEELIKLAEEMFGAGDIARNGIMGLGDHGVNLRGSLATRFGKPDSFMDIFGAPGSVLGDWWEGGKNITKGYYQDGFEKFAPAAFSNISKGVREGTEGVTTRSGSPVYFGKDQMKGDTIDTILRVMSFNPTGISKAKEIKWNEYKIIGRYKDKKADLYKRLRRLYMRPPGERNRSAFIDLYADMRDFNTEIKNKGITRIVRPITAKSRKSALRKMTKAPKRERLRKE